MCYLLAGGRTVVSWTIDGGVQQDLPNRPRAIRVLGKCVTTGSRFDYKLGFDQYSATVDWETKKEAGVIGTKRANATGRREYVNFCCRLRDAVYG